MKNRHKKIVIIVAIAICFTLTVFSFSGCLKKKEVNEYREQIMESADKARAAIIAGAFNTNNVFVDEEKKLTQLPETLDDFNLFATAVPISMEKDEYENALPYIEFDEEGKAYVIED